MRARRLATHSTGLCAAVALSLTGCRQSASNAIPSSRTAGTEIRISRLPPQPKDIIEALLRSSEVSLSVDSSCNGVGSEASDKTIGRYVSGLLAEQSKPQGRNWIETTMDSAKNAAGEDVWRSHVVIRHVDGDDRWGWGVEFLVRQEDGVVLQDSFRCTGGG